jgi:hypothetical protein
MMADGEKNCRICGQDCAGQPRIKDPNGCYYHETCYEQAKQRIAQREAQAAEPDVLDLLETPPMPEASPLIDEDEPIIELADEVSGAAFIACPGCQKVLPAASVVCTDCGYNRTTGEQLAVDQSAPASSAKSSRQSAGIGSRLLSPLPVTLIALLIFGILFGLAMTDPAMVMLYSGVTVLYGAVMSIAVLVFAFRDGIVQGLLTLIVPFWILYFAFVVCENGYIKGLYLVALLNIAGIMYLGFGQEMPSLVYPDPAPGAGS